MSSGEEVARKILHTLDLGLDIVNGVGGLHLKGDSLTRKGLDEDLHLDEGLGGELVEGRILVMCRCVDDRLPDQVRA